MRITKDNGQGKCNYTVCQCKVGKKKKKKYADQTIRKHGKRNI